MTGVLLINALMWILPPGMVFYPIRVPEATPHDWGPPFEDVERTDDDGTRLHGRPIPYPGATRTL
jgi:hypothetical protein